MTSMIATEQINKDCKDLELISLHIPKSGGTSFLLWLHLIYGKNKVLYDDADNPANYTSVVNIDPDGYLETFESGYPLLRGKKAVHGHLWIKKYQYIENVLRITFLRDPIDRLISEYWNMKIFAEGRNTRPGKGVLEIFSVVRKYRAACRKKRSRGIPEKIYFMEKNLDIGQFARLPLLRNIYTSTFFRGVDPAVFDMIGDQARMDSEIERLSKMLGVEVGYPALKANVTSLKSSGYKEFKLSIRNNKDLMAKITDLLADDIAFYEKYAGT